MELPAITHLSLSCSTLKYTLKQIFWAHFTNHFNPNITCTFHIDCPCSNYVHCNRSVIASNLVLHNFCLPHSFSLFVANVYYYSIGLCMMCVWLHDLVQSKCLSHLFCFDHFLSTVCLFSCIIVWCQTVSTAMLKESSVYLLLTLYLLLQLL